METQLFNILTSFKNIKYLKDDNKKICIEFYNFFINNYKKYNSFNNLINIFLYYNKHNIKNTILFLNNFFNINIKIDKNVILNEITRQHYIKNYNINKHSNIINFNSYKNKYKKIGYFIVYLKWFDNYIILKDIHTNKIFKLCLSNDIINYIMINDILKLEIIKKEKSFWQMLNLLEFYPNKLEFNLKRL